jgi:archaellum biogenesis protein FlaJ (TadC family)
MTRRRYAEIQPWMLFAFPLAIAVPIIAAILLGGPIVGFPVALLVAVVIVGVAIRMQPQRRRAAAEAPSVAADGGRRTATAVRFAASAAIVVAGIVVIVATGDTGSIIGWALMAVGLTLAVSFMFLEIGYSEDRARAAERRRERRAPPPGGGAGQAH